MNELIQEIRVWCKKKNGLVYLPLFILFCYVFFRLINDSTYQSILDPLNLGIHEVGHLLFGFLGEFIGILGGTLFQLIVPIYGIFNFYKLQDYFSISLCFGWYAINCYNIATYAADARAMDLPLVSPFGGHIKHDWNYMLSKLGWLNSDQLIATLFRIEGFFAFAFCLLCGGWMLWLMFSSSEKK